MWAFNKRAVKNIYYEVPNDCPGYKKGFSSAAMEGCFAPVNLADLDLDNPVYCKIRTADKRRGFRQINPESLRGDESFLLFQVKDEVALQLLLEEFDEAFLEVDMVPTESQT